MMSPPTISLFFLQKKVVSDEGSDVSDGEVEGDINHLPRRVLRSSGELNCRKKEELIQQIPDPKTVEKSNSKKKRKLREWKNLAPQFKLLPPVDEEDMERDPLSPLEFHLLIPKILGMMDSIIGPRNKKVDILDANNVGHEQT